MPALNSRPRNLPGLKICQLEILGPEIGQLENPVTKTSQLDVINLEIFYILSLDLEISQVNTDSIEIPVP